MATLVRGKTFGATETVTNTKLHQLIDSGSVSAIVKADMDGPTTSFTHIGTSAPTSNPTPVQGHQWFDSSNNVLKTYDGTDWQPNARGYLYTNQSGGTVAAGALVVLDTSNAQSFTTTTTVNDTDAFGFTIGSTAAAAKGIVITEGIILVANVTGSTSIGDYLFASTTAAKADPSATLASGAVARALTASSTAVVAQVGVIGAVQAVQSSDTFEFEAKRTSSVSNSSASPTTITFDTAFNTPPIIVGTVEDTATVGFHVIDYTTSGSTFTGFKAYITSSGAKAVNWFACTAGQHQVTSTTFIQAGTADNPDGSGDGNASLHSRAQSDGLTATVCASVFATTAAGNGLKIACQGRNWGLSTSDSLNFTGTNTMIRLRASAAINADKIMFVIFNQTSTVQTGTTTTADGSQATIGSSKLEAGVVMNAASATPTLTFATAFSAAPIVFNNWR